MDVILKLLGVWREKAGHIARIGLGYHGDVPLWLVVLIALVLVGLVFWMYHRTAQYVSPARRYTLAALRSAFLCLLLVLVLHPVLTVTVAGSVRQALLLLVDSSASMKIKDMRVENDDAKRAAIAKGALDPAAGLKQDLKARPPEIVNASRMDLVKSSLTNDKLNLLERLENDYDLVPFAFDRSVSEVALAKPAEPETSNAGQVAFSLAVVLGLLAVIAGAILAAFFRPRAVGITTAVVGAVVFAASLALLMWADSRRKAEAPRQVANRTEWVNKLQANGTGTALGDAVRDAVYRKRGQSVVGIVAITDGGSNAGSLPAEAAKLAGREGMPLYLWGVGITAPRDIIVQKIEAQDVVFVRDEVTVTVPVHAQGLKGQPAKVELRLGQNKVAEQEVTFASDEDDARVEMKFTPQQVGDFELTAAIAPRPDEVVQDNNSATHALRIIDGHVKVLQIEQLPRWEFKYLQAMLMRDRRVEYKCVLLDGDPAITEGPDTPYLKSVPTLSGDFARNYDVVILGDVDPHRLSPATMDALNDYVARLGGSVIVIAGKEFTPHAYRKTPVEKMLPVEFDAILESTRSGRETADKPIRLELTEDGKAATMLKLADKDAESLRHWAQLPPIFWTARVARAKPAAQVLLVDPDPAKNTRTGKMPVMALQQYGLGQVLYVGTENTWRWRKNTSEQDFTRLWGQIIERMAMTHMLGAARRTQLTTDRQAYSAGDRVTVFARLYREKDFEPITDRTVKATWASKDASGAQGTLDLQQLPDQPGMYRGVFTAPAAGSYRLKTEVDRDTSLDFTVAESTLELAQTAMNEKLLREMAQNSGGGFFREEDLVKLPESLHKAAQMKPTTFEVEFAFSPLYFLVLMGVVTTEWIVRKVAQLK